MYSCQIILFAICQLIYSANGANILAITAVLSPSHHIWNRALMIGLAEKGHNVTFIGPDKEKTVTPNLTGIHMEGVYESVYSEISVMDFIDKNPIEEWNGFYEWGLTTCRLEMETNGVKTLLNYPRNFFDLIIMDTFTTDCYYPMVEYFGSPPIIGVNAYGLIPWSSYFTGDYEYPAIVPVAGHMTNRMTFNERVWNFIYTYYLTYMYKYYSIPNYEKIHRQYYGADIKPMIQNMNEKMSIHLSNIHPVIDYPRPTVPSVISVSGLHIKPSGPIPDNVKKFLDEAKDGFILFSLGTNVRSDNLGKDKINEILKAFKQIPYKVLWKWESDSLPGKPDNVMIQKWLPGQGNILEHQNIRLFVTHGGGLSTQEAIYHGVPILGIPFFADQRMNVNKMVERGYGLKIDYGTLSSEKLLKTLQEVINNQKFKNNIKRASEQFRDQPETPLERALFWTEYVLRHGGAEHLHPPSLHMSAWQTYSLDVLALLLAIAITIITIPICLCRYLFKSKKCTKKLKIN